jgi:hypothetical protein
MGHPIIGGRARKIRLYLSLRNHLLSEDRTGPHQARKWRRDSGVCSQTTVSAMGKWSGRSKGVKCQPKSPPQGAAKLRSQLR